MSFDFVKIFKKIDLHKNDLDMSDPKFYEEVTNSALSSTKRKYKNMKIKITTDEYQLNFD